MHPVIVRQSRTGGQQTLYPVGELDAVVADRFEVMVAAALTDDRLTGVVVDLSAVTFLDCAGVGALVASRRSEPRRRSTSSAPPDFRDRSCNSPER